MVERGGRKVQGRVGEWERGGIGVKVGCVHGERDVVILRMRSYRQKGVACVENDPY